MKYEIFKKNNNCDRILYLFSSREECYFLKELDINIVLLSVENWNDDLSVWHAKVLKSDFAGGADNTISQLEEIVKECEKDLSIKKRFLVGYSLAGLFSLYCWLNSSVFDSVASCSGSLWYPDFVEYLKNKELPSGNVYLSLGDRESKSRNSLLSTVQNCTEDIYYHLLVNKVNTCFQLNKGGHFDEVPLRLLKAISWLNN